MIKIRFNTFETNSSSMHSLVIKKKSDLTPKEINCYVNSDGVWNLNWERLTFDREPFEMLYSSTDKFKYLIAAFWEDKDIIDKLVEYIKEIYPEIKEVRFPVYDEYNKPFIDHQSFGLVSKYIEENNISLYDFLADNKYIIIIDGDEYCVWESVKDSGLVNLDEIEKEINYYTGFDPEEEYDLER